MRIITVDVRGNIPKTESEWESFNIDLERLIEQAIEANDTVNMQTTEVILEEIGVGGR